MRMTRAQLGQSKNSRTNGVGAWIIGQRSLYSDPKYFEGFR